MAKAFALETAQAPTQRTGLIAHDVGTELAVGTQGVTRVADILARIDHDRSRQRMPAPRDLDQRFAILGAHVGRVYDGKLATPQADLDRRVQ